MSIKYHLSFFKNLYSPLIYYKLIAVSPPSTSLSSSPISPSPSDQLPLQTFISLLDMATQQEEKGPKRREESQRQPRFHCLESHKNTTLYNYKEIHVSLEVRNNHSSVTQLIISEPDTVQTQGTRWVAGGQVL